VKVVFLDIDGVLNCGADWSASRRTDALTQVCVERFAGLLSRTRARIVLSSTWRHAYGLVPTMKALERHGCPCAMARCVGQTPDGKPLPRGWEILQWLEKTPHVVDAYVILDDMTDAGWGHDPRVHVQTNWQTGLTDEDVARAEEVLRDEQ
jgi:hypothetical protein